MSAIKLYYRLRGEEGAPWLVMMHGLFGSGDNLGGIARILEENFRILLMDARNHGRSPHARGMAYPDMAGDALAVMDELNIETAHVFGHSMGGKTAMQLALSHPDRVNRLMIGDIAPVQYGHHHSRILDGMQRVAEASPQSRAGASEILSEYEAEDAVLSFLLTNWRRQDDGVWGWRIGFSEISEGYDALMRAPKGAAFDKPVLFLRGEKSDYIQPSHRDTILSLFPQADVKNFAGCGHWLHAEKPDMVARAMIRFMSA